MDAPPPESLPCTFPRVDPLLEGVLLRRYKRFFADVRLLDGTIIVAHCVNTGTMEGLTLPGTRVWVSRATNPARKLAYTWELAEVDGLTIGANTGVPNRLVGRLIAEHRLPFLAAWDEWRAEKPFGDNQRVDFWIRRKRRVIFLEVKNCHLAYSDRRAYFPDTVSERATHHLHSLAAVIDERTRAEVLFCVQVPGVRAIRPSDVHDPEFGRAAREAASRGVKFRAIVVRQTPTETVVEGFCPVDLKPYSTERIAAWKNDWKKRRDAARP